MNGDFGPNGRGLLGWFLDNVSALVEALSAAASVLSRYKRRNFWVWLFALSAFFYTFLSEASSGNSQNSDSHGEVDTAETKGVRQG